MLLAAASLLAIQLNIDKVLCYKIIVCSFVAQNYKLLSQYDEKGLVLVD